MKRVRQRVKELTGRNRSGVKDVRVLIADLNPVLRGWGNYFRTGNAAQKFNQIDTYVWQRLRRLHGEAQGPEPARRVRHSSGTATSSIDLGLHRLRGTVQYPEAA